MPYGCFVNLQIIIEDCIKVLKESIEKGVKYDYVINDLTEFPVDKVSQGKYLEFYGFFVLVLHQVQIHVFAHFMK